MIRFLPLLGSHSGRFSVHVHHDIPKQHRQVLDGIWLQRYISRLTAQEIDSSIWSPSSYIANIHRSAVFTNEILLSRICSVLNARVGSLCTVLDLVKMILPETGNRKDCMSGTCGLKASFRGPIHCADE